MVGLLTDAYFVDTFTQMLMLTRKLPEYVSLYRRAMYHYIHMNGTLHKTDTMLHSTVAFDALHDLFVEHLVEATGKTHERIPQSAYLAL